MDLGTRGQALYDDLHDAGKRFDPAREVLCVEACRIADRLEKLDELLRGDVDVWATLTHNTRTQDYELIIDKALSEARQQQLALRAVVQALGVSAVSEASKGSKADELAARRTARRADPANSAGTARRGQPRRRSGGDRTS